MPRIRRPSERDRTYGSIPLGANAELFLLDQRQYRDDQPCGDQFFVPCSESEAPGRTLLGAAQKAWFKDALARSRATWKVVANQVMIMSLDAPARNEVNKDQWDGYAAERAEILQFVARPRHQGRHVHHRRHPQLLRRQRHADRPGGLPSDPPPVATEFVGGSITSKGIIPDAAREAGVIVTDNGLLTQNPPSSTRTWT